MYADVELLLIPWVAATFDARAATDTPSNLSDVLPFVQVLRYGGGDSDLTVDQASVSIDCYAASRGDAFTLARRIQKALRFTLPGSTLTAEDGTQGWVSRVDTITGPFWRPYDDTDLRRVGADYRLTITSQS